MNELQKQTAGAQRAMGLAQLVNKVFAADRVASSAAGHAGYRLEMLGPEGPSTTQLAKVEDRIELVPVDAAKADARILVGTSDPGMSSAVLRSFDNLRARYASAPGGELPLDRADYERLLGKIEAFFDRQGVPVTIVSAPVVSAPPKPAAAKRGAGPFIALAVVTALALAAWLLWRH